MHPPTNKRILTQHISPQSNELVVRENRKANQQGNLKPKKNNNTENRTSRESTTEKIQQPLEIARTEIKDSPPVYQLKRGKKGIETLDFNLFLDGFIPFLVEHKVLFTNEVEALKYFEKCDHRANWIFGTERVRILKVLLGLNLPKPVTNFMGALTGILNSN